MLCCRTTRFRLFMQAALFRPAAKSMSAAGPRVVISPGDIDCDTCPPSLRYRFARDITQMVIHAILLRS